MRFIILALLALLFTGCGYEMVPPGNAGKILTTSGWKPDTVPSGKTWVGWREQLVLLETTTNRQKESLKVNMADELPFNFDVYARLRVDRKQTAGLFDDLQVKWRDGVGSIDFSTIYATYAQQQIRSLSRAILTKYECTQVKDNVREISAELYAEVSTALESTPLKLEEITLSGYTLPAVINQAYEITAQKEIELGQIEADKAKELAALDAELVLAQKRREIELAEAATQRDYDLIVGETYSEAWLARKHYEVMAKLAESGNTVFMPYEAYRLQNAGLQNAIHSAAK